MGITLEPPLFCTEGSLNELGGEGLKSGTIRIRLGTQGHNGTAA